MFSYVVIEGGLGMGETVSVGKFWSILIPLSVTANDIFAFFFGKAFGRTKLISLSPNKTLEGFIGGALSNMIFAILMCYYPFDDEFFICTPKNI